MSTSLLAYPIRVQQYRSLIKLSSINMMISSLRIICDRRMVPLFLSCLLVACSTQNTDSGHTTVDASGKVFKVGGLETFRYWAEGEPGSSTEVLNGQYWSSSHFTKEYIMYLELRSSWAKDFPTENGLQRAVGPLEIPKDAPDWFSPSEDYDVWIGSQGSLYFIDPNSGHMFFHEVQL